MAATPKQAASPQQYPHTPEDLRKEPNYPIWVRLRAGDRGARDELVVKYAPLVKYVIGRMAISLPAAMDSDDVLSAGTVGLLHAIDRFDPDQGVRFETYALQRIRGAIDSLPPRDRLVLNLYYHEELTLKEISRVIEVSESRVSQIHTAAVMKLRALLRTGAAVPARAAA